KNYRSAMVSRSRLFGLGSTGVSARGCWRLANTNLKFMKVRRLHQRPRRACSPTCSLSVSMNLHISTFRIGDPPKRDEGLRVGATRLPPRGVPKSRWKKDGYFDVWLPTVAPSRKLLGWIKQRDINDDKTRRVFFVRY